MQYYHAQTDTYIASGAAFMLDDNQYPANWLDLATPEQIIDLGLQPVTIVGERLDDTFFDHAETTAAGITTIVATPKPLATIKAELAIRIAAARFAIETAGIVVGGVAVATDRQSQSMIASALQIVTRNPVALIDWKGETGWAQIDKTTVEAIADAVGAHVQSCFSAERTRQEALAAIETLTDLLAFDTTVAL